jgi:hypothetical protein
MMMRTPRPKPVNIRTGTHGGLGGAFFGGGGVYRDRLLFDFGMGRE